MQIAKILSLTLILLFFFIDISWSFYIDSLENPSSVVYDNQTKKYFIANVNGVPNKLDNNGYISLVDEDNNIIDKKFISSGKNNLCLNSPMSIIIVGDILYILDVNVIHAVNKFSGLLLFDIQIDSSQYLCDITVDNLNNLYVTDSFNNCIYKVNTYDFTSSIFVQNSGFNFPTGITFTPDKKKLLIASWGSGKIFEISPNKKISIKYSYNFGNISSIAYDNTGKLYVSDYSRNSIYKVDIEGNIILMSNAYIQPSKIFFDFEHKSLIVPSFKNNFVRSISIN